MAKLDAGEHVRLEALKLSVQSAGGLSEEQIFKRAYAFSEFICGSWAPTPQPAPKKITPVKTDDAIPPGADLGDIEPGEDEI